MEDVNSLKGIHVLRTMQSTKKRSIPRTQSSIYLDSYILNTEKERLIKEDERICMRRDAIKKRLEEINQQMSEMQEVRQHGIKTSRNISFSERENGLKKEWKKITLSY